MATISTKKKNTVTVDNNTTATSKDTNANPTRASSAYIKYPDNQSNKTSGGYVPSSNVNSAKSAMTVHNSAKPPAYTSKYDDLIDSNLNSILNREKFSYDPNSDALYQQYKDSYTRNGQTAMKDTMGNAALLTGGYGNSYAVTAGQQAYNNYMQQLADKIPELEQRAYERYRDDTSDLYNQSDLLNTLESRDYGRYRDDVSDYLNDRDYYYNAYNNERNFDYGKYRDDVGDAKDDRNFNYQKDRDAVADSQWQKQYDRGVYESDRNFGYQKDRDAVADSQWQKQYDRGVYESDRDYSFKLSQFLAANKEEVEDDSVFDPNVAYKFLTDYEDYFGSTASTEEQAESLFQMYSTQDGFWEWAENANLGDGTSVADVIFDMHPELLESDETKHNSLFRDGDVASMNQTPRGEWLEDMLENKKKNSKK